ncbi:MAG: Asp/Glu/hydantoin racemase, partial [Rhodoferax sp.]|nr:Asp/Glu/hydantoin racemase [Rhodoferax sp.]
MTPPPTSPQPRSAARLASRLASRGPLFAAICAVCALLPGLAAAQGNTAATEDRYIVLINPNS